MRHQRVVMVGDGDVGDDQPLADLQDSCLAEKRPGRRLHQEIDVEIGGDGKRHPAERNHHL